MKNLRSKTMPITNPYETYRSPLLPDWEWRVLKHYQSEDKEKTDPYARVFVAVKSPMTYGDWEMGDEYIKTILEDAKGVLICN